MKNVFNTKVKVTTALAWLAAVLVGIGSGAVVLASIPDGNGVIHACYSTLALNKGNLRVIDSPSQTCRNNENALNWNQQSQNTQQTLSNHAYVALDSDTNSRQVTLLDIPGFATISYDPSYCSSSSPFLATAFTNTSGNIENVNSISSSGPSPQYINPNVLYGLPSGPTRFTLIKNVDNNQDKQAVTIEATPTALRIDQNSIPAGCYYNVVATPVN